MTKRKKTDGRSHPTLVPCERGRQRYILRHCTKNGLRKVGDVEETGKHESTTAEEIEAYLRGKGHKSGTFVLLSTRPRPKCLGVYKFVMPLRFMGLNKIVLRRIK
ncbi:MAG: hypothetical protein V1934_06555 [Methanobacteriota archaeon]